MGAKLIIIGVIIILAIVGGVFGAFLYQNVYKYDLPSRYKYEYSANVIRVACVGDSNTQGGEVGEEMQKYSYPAQLGELLGDDYCAANYGVNGATASSNIAQTYSKKRGYKYSIEFEPDIVIINFGTNDSKNDNWDREKYNREYRQLIQSYVDLPNNPRIIVCVPIPAFSTEWGIQPKVVQEEVQPDIIAICEELNLEYINLFGAFEDKEEYYLDDGIHLTHEGYAEMAKVIYESIDWEE